MFKGASRLTIALIALALMLFAQGAMAWAPCQLPERSPALALSIAAGHECCEDEVAATTPLCFTHCLAEKQALYKGVLDVPPMPSTPVLVLAARIETVLAGHSIGSPPPIAATGPPRRILLQSFQI